MPVAPAGWVTAVQDGWEVLLRVTRAHGHAPEIAEWIASHGDGHQRGIELAWASHLSAHQFRVLRMRATDEAFSGAYVDHFAPGRYCCAACGRELYLASHKFRVACGWPSFSDNVDGALLRIEGKAVALKGGGPLRRVEGHTEIACATCHSHVGHVYKSPNHPPPRHERTRTWTRTRWTTCSLIS